MFSYFHSLAHMARSLFSYMDTSISTALILKAIEAYTHKSEVLQCDLCAVWVHTRCKGVSSEFADDCLLYLPIKSEQDFILLL